MITRIAMFTFPLILFAYGIAVGHYKWPPFDLLKSALRTVISAQSKAAWEARVSLFKDTPGFADIVMLGDSLSEAGNWSELLTGMKVINRGIGSDTSAGVLARLPEIIARRPKLVFIMIGENDLEQRTSPEDTARNIRAIVRMLSEHHINSVIQSVLHVAQGHKPDINSKVKRLNELLKVVGNEDLFCLLI